MRRVSLSLAFVLTACGSDGAGPPPPNAVAGTYSEYTIDNQQVPISTSTPGDTCPRVNTGGWLSLTGDGGYSFVLDRTGRVCNGVFAGGDYLGQRGTYKMVNDSFIAFLPSGTYGPAFSATYDPGNYTPGQGGRLRGLRFSFAGHEYWAIEEVPPLSGRR